MTQSSLERSVARATGESVERIRRMGFSLLSPPAVSCAKPHRAHAARHPARSLPVVAGAASVSKA